MWRGMTTQTDRDFLILSLWCVPLNLHLRFQIWCTAESSRSPEGGVGSVTLDTYQYKHSLQSSLQSDLAAKCWARPNTGNLVPACVGHRHCCLLCCRPLLRVKQVNVTSTFDNEAAFYVPPSPIICWSSCAAIDRHLLTDTESRTCSRPFTLFLPQSCRNAWAASTNVKIQH